MVSINGKKNRLLDGDEKIIHCMAKKKSFFRTYDSTPSCHWRKEGKIGREVHQSLEMYRLDNFNKLIKVSERTSDLLVYNPPGTHEEGCMIYKNQLAPISFLNSAPVKLIRLLKAGTPGEDLLSSNSDLLQVRPHLFQPRCPPLVSSGIQMRLFHYSSSFLLTTELTQYKFCV